MFRRSATLIVVSLLSLGLLLAVTIPSASAAGRPPRIMDAGVPTPVIPAPVPSPPRTPGPSGTLLAAINHERAQHHAAPLTIDSKESRCSLRHSVHMASLGYISHDQFPGDLCIQHTFGGENVGMASGDPAAAALLLNQFMMNEGPCPRKGCTLQQSEAHGHYLNLINPAYRRVGIGIYVKGGIVWLTEDFVG